MPALFIDGLFCHSTCLDGCFQDTRIHELPPGHFEIQAVVRRKDTGICGCPVRHEDTFESPLIAEHVLDESLVFRHVYAVHQIVGRHHGSCFRDLYGLAECRKINLVQSSLIYIR